MVLVNLKKSNSRTFQGLSRTIQDYINAKRHFYKHI